MSDGTGRFLDKDEEVGLGFSVGNFILDLLRGKWRCVVGMAQAGVGVPGAPAELWALRLSVKFLNLVSSKRDSWAVVAHTLILALEK